MDWKQSILTQLQEKNRLERDVYSDIVKHYNRLFESYSILLIRSSDQERDILALRQEHNECIRLPIPADFSPPEKMKQLEKELMKGKDEILNLLRERNDLTKEIISLSRLVKERDEKLVTEETRSQILKKDNTNLKQKVDAAIKDLDDLGRVNQTIHDELQALQLAYNQLELRYKAVQETNTILKTKLTEKMDAKVEDLDRELSEHERNKDEKIRSDLDDAKIEDPPQLSRSGGTSPSSIPDYQRRTLVTEPVVVTVPKRAVTKWDCGDHELHAVQFHPSGTLLATGGSDRRIHIWEMNSSTNQIQSLYVLSGNNSTVTAIDFDNEGANLILGCSEDFACRVWGLADQRLRHTLTGHGAKVFCAKFITATSIASGSQDRTLKAWDLQHRQCVRTLFAGSKCHDLVALDSSGNLISGHFDKKIRFWDSRNDTPRCELQFQAAITSLSINRDKQLLLACSRDDTLKLIELRENRVIQTYSHPDFKITTDTIKATLSPDCAYVCAGGNDGAVYIWDANSAKIEKVLNKEHSSIINAVAWHPHGRFIVSCERQRRAVLWGE